MKSSSLPSSPASLPSSASSSAPRDLRSWEAAALSLPLSPGVYWFLDDAGNVLYVGKAKSLKQRLSSYRQFNQLSPRIHQLVHTATQLKHQVLESELEALLVEAELIRAHQPQFNVLLKDDKTPLYIYISDELFPKVLTKRKKEVETLSLKGTILGPFPSAYKVREVLKIARHIFPWCNQEGKPCFYYHLGLCPGACVQTINADAYQHIIKQLIIFLRGQKKDIVRQLEQEMKMAVELEKYEGAAVIKNKIDLIRAVTQQTYRLRPNIVLPQLRSTQAEEGIVQLRMLLSNYLSLPKNYPLHRLECYDVSNISGTDAAVAMVTFSDGLSDTDQYRVFNIRSLNTPNDFAMLQEALLRRQNHAEWGQPDLIIIDGGKGQLRAALKVWQWLCPVISIAKDPDRLIFPKQGSGPSYHELKLPPTHPALKLVQQLRDEAHRFSKKQHHRRRLRSFLP